MPRRLRFLFVSKHRLFFNPSTSSAFATEIPLPFSHEISSTNTAIAISNKLKSSLTSIFIHLPKNNFVAASDIKTFTTFILIRLSSNDFATSTKNIFGFCVFGTKIMLDSYLTDNF